MISITGTSLDGELCNIKHQSVKKYEQYKEGVCTSGTFGNLKLTPVFITAEDHLSHFQIENKTKDEIRKELE